MIQKQRKKKEWCTPLPSTYLDYMFLNVWLIWQSITIYNFLQDFGKLGGQRVSRNLLFILHFIHCFCNHWTFGGEFFQKVHWAGGHKASPTFWNIFCEFWGSNKMLPWSLCSPASIPLLFLGLENVEMLGLQDVSKQNSTWLFFKNKQDFF